MKVSKATIMFGVLFIAGILCSTPLSCLAVTFLDLQPGRSTKADADKKLGTPVKEVMKGIQYDYQPRLDARRLSITFHSGTMIIKSIDVYSSAPFIKGEYQEWLQLQAPARKTRDTNGHLVEHYPEKGIALHFAGKDDTATVTYISYYDVAPPEPKGSVPKVTPQGTNQEHYYDQQADQAINAKDWARAKKLIETGLRRYPNSAELWHTRAMYYFRAKSEPGEVRVKQAKYSMYRAYKLNPSGKFAAEMGWLHKEFHNNCSLALSYFEEAERKGYTKESPDVLYWMGYCYEKLGMLRSAKTHYQRLLNRAPGSKKRALAEAALKRLP